MEAGRPYRAIDLAAMYLCRERAEREKVTIPSALLLKLLDDAPSHAVSDEWFPPAVNSIGHNVEDLLDALERHSVEPSALAALEWKWMPALEHGQRGLKALQQLLSVDPSVFVEILKLLFRAEGQEPHDETSDDERSRAEQAFRLLEDWRVVPGSIGTKPPKPYRGDIGFAEGKVDKNGLFGWVRKAQDLAEVAKRRGVCDFEIGKVLAHSPQDPDSSWPCEAVRDLIEDMENDELERGLAVGIYNRRGAFFRDKGGKQERALAFKFHQCGERVRTRWPRTARVLRQIAESYEREAKMFDEREERMEFDDD